MPGSQLRCRGSWDLNFDSDPGTGSAVGVGTETEVPNGERDEEYSNNPGDQRASTTALAVYNNWSIGHGLPFDGCPTLRSYAWIRQYPSLLDHKHEGSEEPSPPPRVKGHLELAERSG